MKVPELKQDSIITEWLQTLNPSANTVRNYLMSMQAFTEWVDMEPEELVEEAESEMMSDIVPRKRKVKSYLVGFRNNLQASGLAPITIRGYLTGVRSFYKSFDIELPTLPKAGNKARTLEKNNKIPTKEDIQAVLKVADPLEKAIVLLGISSGLAANEIISLTVGQFKNGYDSDTEITTITMRRAKVGYDFTTFLAPEASRTVWEYLTYRERTAKTTDAKKLNQLEKQRVRDDSDALFCRRWVTDKYLTVYDDSLRKMNLHALMKLYRQLSDKTARSEPVGQWNLIRSHNMRKYFYSALLNAGCDSFHAEFFMGHTLDDTKSAYFRASPDKLREIYKQYIPYLTIQKELDVASSPEYQELLRQNKIHQTESARHIVERSEVVDMHKRMSAMQKTVNVLIEQVGYETFKKINTKLQDEINGHIMDDELLGFDWSDVEE
ncbi:tyrosine-type recombinase/integrase [Methanolobus sp. ZRKC3]|uniref:tyrosine-type recombinase/integrase n=1 Tax=Methanolobus sp. ZRKC3 TaxID=3125786 RepID=UPI0032495E0E